MKRIYVVINPNLQKEDVIDQLREEGYDHYFCLGSAESGVVMEDYLKESEEVWCFGNCEKVADYVMAKELGKDIWQMG